MTGIYFYLQLLFGIFLLWATSTAVYMGVFHAHGATVSLGRKTVSGALSLAFAATCWFFLYSWTYLSW